MLFVCFIQPETNSNWFPCGMDQRNQTGLVPFYTMSCKLSVSHLISSCDIYEAWDLLIILNKVGYFSMCWEGSGGENQVTLRDLKCKSLQTFFWLCSSVWCLANTVWGLIPHHLCDGVPSGFVEKRHSLYDLAELIGQWINYQNRQMQFKPEVTVCFKIFISSAESLKKFVSKRNSLHGTESMISQKQQKILTLFLFKTLNAA